MGDKHQVAAQLLLGVPPDAGLLLRLQVVGVPAPSAVPLRRQTLGVVKAQAGDAVRRRQLHPQAGQLRGVLLGQQGHGVPQIARLQLDHVVKGADIPQLEVQPGVLVEVPGGGVLFRPEHGADLKHPLKHPRHGLLVELGGLGQVRLFAEVVQPEDAGAALCPGTDDLGRVDLGEALPGEVVPEGPHQPLLDSEHRPLPPVPKDGGAQGQPGVQVQPQPPLGQGQGQGGGGPGQHRDGLRRDLQAAGGPGLRPDGAGQLHTALLAQARREYVRGAHALDGPPGQPQGEEGQPAHLPQGVDGSVDGGGAVIPSAPREVLPAGRFSACASDELHNIPPFLVIAKSAQLRFRLWRKLRSLPCSSSPHRTRFAGLRRGPQIIKIPDCTNVQSGTEQ